MADIIIRFIIEHRSYASIYFNSAPQLEKYLCVKFACESHVHERRPPFHLVLAKRCCNQYTSDVSSRNTSYCDTILFNLSPKMD